MRTNIPWATTEASTDGGFEKLPAGPYVAKIVDMVDNDSKQYVELVFDIAEGEHANFYGDKWGKEHPFAHHIFLSYKAACRPSRRATPVLTRSPRGTLAAWTCSTGESLASTSRKRNTSATTARPVRA